MIQSISARVCNLLQEGNERSNKILRNVILSFGVKGGSIIVGLILVPMTINYISPLEYGIWLTISSVISWMSFFDIGMGNGLRNKLTQALVKEEYDEARKYVSTTYAALTLISLTLFMIFWIAFPALNWNTVLKVPSKVSDDILLIVQIVASSFCIQFVFQIINVVLLASHKQAVASLISFLGQLGLLLTVFVLRQTIPGSLTVLVVALTLVPLIVMAIASIILYKTKFNLIAPSFKKINFKYAKGILNIGGKFFVIQIGAMILFQTDNIIITQILGPEAVTTFNVSYKIFSVIIMVFSIIITPYWSAFTDAYVQRDFSWMVKSIKKLRQLWGLLSLVSLVLLICSKEIYKIWLGNSVLVPLSLSIAMFAYVIAYVWQTLHVIMLNGISKVKLQLVLVVGSALLNIPLAFYFGKKFGLAGIISANTIMFVLMGIIFSLQVQKILHQKAEGIWNQ